MSHRSQKSAIANRRAAARGLNRREYADRRGEIIAAAAKVFKERGFRGTTLNHVAEAMSADRASMYYYFASKQELFQEIVIDAVKANVETAIAIRDGEGTAADKLRRLIEHMMDSYANNYPVLYVLIQENLSHVSPERSAWADEMRGVTREYEKAVIDIVEMGQREGTIRDIAPAWLLAYGVIGMVGWTNRWFNPRQSAATAEEIGAAFAETVLHGLAEPAGGATDGSPPR
jgi:AcrR family transcriptional regulator